MPKLNIFYTLQLPFSILAKPIVALKVFNSKSTHDSTFLGLRGAAVARCGWCGICLGGRLCLGAGVCFRREVRDGRVVRSHGVLSQRFVPILGVQRLRLKRQSWRTEKETRQLIKRCHKNCQTCDMSCLCCITVLFAPYERFLCAPAH